MDHNIRVSKILIHPIKVPNISCRGISVQHARYTPAGMEYDRTWCIVDEGKEIVLTAREAPKMILITPQIDIDGSGGSLSIHFPPDSDCPSFTVALNPTLEVLKTWRRLEHFLMFRKIELDGYVCESNPPGVSETLSNYLGRPVSLVYKGPQLRACHATDTNPQLEANVSYQDEFPILVLSEESVGQVDEVMKEQIRVGGITGIDERWKDDSVAIERFRPNIVLKGAGAFAEDAWSNIVIGQDGSSAFALVAKCMRCLLPNVNPETGIRDPAVPYKVMLKFRTGLVEGFKMKACMGCHAVPARNGEVKVGDKVVVKGRIAG